MGEGMEVGEGWGGDGGGVGEGWGREWGGVKEGEGVGGGGEVGEGWGRGGGGEGSGGRWWGRGGGGGGVAKSPLCEQGCQTGVQMSISQVSSFQGRVQGAMVRLCDTLFCPRRKVLIEPLNSLSRCRAIHPH